MEGDVRAIGEASVDDINLLFVRREGNAVGLDKIVDDHFDVTGFRVDPVDVVLFLLRIGFDTLIIGTM